jgi:mannose-6-phosphate isomerase-like protein (cupin superfamily)
MNTNDKPIGAKMTTTIRRIITGHDTNGMGGALMDGELPLVEVQPGVETALLWVTDETPADMSGSNDRAQRTLGVAPPPNGSLLRIVDFHPVSSEVKGDSKVMAAEIGGQIVTGKGKNVNHPLMHRTNTIDYGIVLEGEIDILFDDTEVHLKAGDIVVQQSTNHAWVNNSDKICRMAFAMIDGVKPPVLKGGGDGH